MKTKRNERKEAALELHAIASCYENVAYSTVYSRIFKNNETWKYIGRAHNYSF